MKLLLGIAKLRPPVVGRISVLRKGDRIKLRGYKGRLIVRRFLGTRKQTGFLSSLLRSEHIDQGAGSVSRINHLLVAWKTLSRSRFVHLQLAADTYAVDFELSWDFFGRINPLRKPFVSRPLMDVLRVDRIGRTSWLTEQQRGKYGVFSTLRQAVSVLGFSLRS